MSFTSFQNILLLLLQTTPSKRCSISPPQSVAILGVKPIGRSLVTMPGESSKSKQHPADECKHGVKLTTEQLVDKLKNVLIPGLLKRKLRHV